MLLELWVFVIIKGGVDQTLQDTTQYFNINKLI